VTRRDVLQIVALAGLSPKIAEVRVEPELQAGDLVVIEAPHRLPHDAIWYLSTRLREELPDGVRIVILEDGVRFSVHRGVGRIEGLDHV